MNQRLEAAKAAMAADPYIQTLVEQYGAREIAGSLRLRPLTRTAEQAANDTLPVIDMRPAQAGTVSH
jgi:hypothetical protein